MSGTGEARVRAARERRDVAELGRLVLDADAGVRIEAAEALSEIGDAAAFDALIASIGTRCDDALLCDRVRAAASVAMSKLGRPTREQLLRLVDMGGAGPWEAMELIRRHGMRDDPLVGLWYRAASGDWAGADASSEEAMAAFEFCRIALAIACELNKDGVTIAIHNVVIRVTVLIANVTYG